MLKGGSWVDGHSNEIGLKKKQHETRTMKRKVNKFQHYSLFYYTIGLLGTETRMKVYGG
jgi:hypothetical protein